MQNSMVVFTWFVLDQKYPFWANLFQKIKVVILSVNLGPRLIRICRIHWWYSLFLFPTGIPLYGRIWSSKSRSSVYAKIWYLDWFEYAEFNGDVHFFCYTGNTLFTFWKTKINETRLLSLRPYGIRDVEIGSCRQHGFFILLRWVCLWMIFVPCLKTF